jgi:hypothetical protein
MTAFQKVEVGEGKGRWEERNVERGRERGSAVSPRGDTRWECVHDRGV